jgi:hypothetical protein
MSVIVMPARVARIHDLIETWHAKTWMAGTSPSMTTWTRGDFDV